MTYATHFAKKYLPWADPSKATSFFKSGRAGSSMRLWPAFGVLICATLLTFAPAATAMAASAGSVPIATVANGAIKVDGNLSDWGSLADNSGIIDEVLDNSRGYLDPQRRGAAAFKFAHDDKALYFAVHVVQASLRPPYKAFIYNGDAVELFLDVRPLTGPAKLGNPKYTDGVYQLVVSAPTEPGTPTYEAAHHFAEGLGPFQVAGKLTQDGYNLEMRIPFTSLNGITAKRFAQPIGFDVEVDDTDLNSSNRRCYGWSRTTDQWENASRFGLLEPAVASHGTRIRISSANESPGQTFGLPDTSGALVAGMIAPTGTPAVAGPTVTLAPMGAVSGFAPPAQMETTSYPGIGVTISRSWWNLEDLPDGQYVALTNAPSLGKPEEARFTVKRPAIDPDAMALVQNSLDAYRGLTAYSDQTYMFNIMDAQVAWEKPDKFRYMITDRTRSSTPIHMFAVSDGKTTWIETDSDQKHYYRQPASATNNPATLPDISGYSWDINLMGSPPSYLTMLANSNSSPASFKLVDLRREPEAVVNGVPTDGITAVYQTTYNKQTQYPTYTIWLGKKDHLVRRFSYGSKQSLLLDRIDSGQTAEYLNVSASSLPARTFAFRPPANLALGKPMQLAQTVTESQTFYDQRLVVGAQPFPFSATDLDGKPAYLAQYRGKVVLLDFWATWCGPCRGELPNVVAAYNKHHSEGFEVLGVSLDNDKSALTSYIKDNNVPYRQIFDGKGWLSSVAGLYKVRAIPFSLLIGKDGRIVAVDPRGPLLDPAVTQALAEKG